MESCMQKSDLLAKLEELGITARTEDHEEVFTVEQALPHISRMGGIFAKNLFLNDKKKNLWLYCAPHYVETKLNDLAKQVGAPGGFRFASEENLNKTLGVKQGSVSVFGLINDSDHKVKLILDRKFWEEDSKEDGGGEAKGASASDKPEGDGDAKVEGEKCFALSSFGEYCNHWDFCKRVESLPCLYRAQACHFVKSSVHFESSAS